MSTPNYFRVYDLPEFDVRYGDDEAFTHRCDSIAQFLHAILAREVRVLRQIPGDCMSPMLWDLCYCASRLMDRIPHEGYSLEESCIIEAPQLLKLAYRFKEYNIVSGETRDTIHSILNFVRTGASQRALESAS